MDFILPAVSGRRLDQNGALRHVGTNKQQLAKVSRKCLATMSTPTAAAATTDGMIRCAPDSNSPEEVSPTTAAAAAKIDEMAIEMDQPRATATATPDQSQRDPIRCEAGRRGLHCRSSGGSAAAAAATGSQQPAPSGAGPKELALKSKVPACDVRVRSDSGGSGSLSGRGAADPASRELSNSRRLRRRLHRSSQELIILDAGSDTPLPAPAPPIRLNSVGEEGRARNKLKCTHRHSGRQRTTTGGADDVQVGGEKSMDQVDGSSGGVAKKARDHHRDEQQQKQKRRHLGQVSTTQTEKRSRNQSEHETERNSSVTTTTTTTTSNQKKKKRRRKGLLLCRTNKAADRSLISSGRRNTAESVAATMRESNESDARQMGECKHPIDPVHDDDGGGARNDMASGEPTRENLGRTPAAGGGVGNGTEIGAANVAGDHEDILDAAGLTSSDNDDDDESCSRTASRTELEEHEDDRCVEEDDDDDEGDNLLFGSASSEEEANGPRKGRRRHQRLSLGHDHHDATGTSEHIGPSLAASGGSFMGLIMNGWSSAAARAAADLGPDGQQDLRRHSASTTSKSSSIKQSALVAAAAAAATANCTGSRRGLDCKTSIIKNCVSTKTLMSSDINSSANNNNNLAGGSGKQADYNV